MRKPRHVSRAIPRIVVLLIAARFCGLAAQSKHQSSVLLSETPKTIVCRDAEGKNVTLDKMPARVVVHYTSFVSLWYQAGGAAVGMCDTANLADLPEAARSLPTTGHVAVPNIEKILSLDPDLVVMSDFDTHKTMRPLLESAGVQTLMLVYNNYSDYLNILDVFYRLNGRDFMSDKKSRAVMDGVGAVAANVKGKAPLRFLSLFLSARDLQAETDRAHTAFVASYLGGKNIVDASMAPSPIITRVALSLERIHMEDPDVIFVTTMGKEKELKEKLLATMKESPAWKGLRAVDAGKVYFLPSELFLYKPNDKFPEAFGLIASYLYPGL